MAVGCGWVVAKREDRGRGMVQGARVGFAHACAAHLRIELTQREVAAAVGDVEARVRVHDAPRDLEHSIRGDETHLHKLLDRLVERELPDEKLHGERRRLSRLVEVWLGRRLGGGLGVGLRHEEELVRRRALPRTRHTRWLEAYACSSQGAKGGCGRTRHTHTHTHTQREREGERERERETYPYTHPWIRQRAYARQGWQRAAAATSLLAPLPLHPPPLCA